MKRPLVIAHRGASGLAPENTLAAVRKAMEAGADLVEVDLQMTRDGRFVVIHDDDLHRTTGASGRAGEKTLEELKRLDAGGWFGCAFQGERIPTLEELLSEARGKVRLDLEIKEGVSPDAMSHFLETIRGAGMMDEVVVSSFQWETLRRLRALSPEIEIGVLSKSYREGVEETKRLGAAAVILSHRRALPSMIPETHARGLAFWIYTVNDPETMTAWVRAGVDGICTDHPDRLEGILRQLLPLC